MIFGQNLEIHVQSTELMTVNIEYNKNQFSQSGW